MMMHRVPGNTKEQHAASRLWNVTCCWLTGITRHLPIVLVSICGASSPGLAATFTVVNLADSGQGSLRQAVLDANASPDANTVTFADGLTGTIVLTSGEMSITNDLTITGPGAALFAVDGNQQSRIFSISNGATVAIAGLTLTNGLATGAHARGGAILNSGGTLSLTQVTFVGNRAVGDPGAAGNGGGIFSLGGPLNVLNSAFIANEARGGVGGGLGLGGAVNNTGPRSTISGCTFLGNRAIGGDGGVVVGAQPFEVVGGGVGGAVRNGNAGVLTVENSLFDGNQAIGGNGGSAAPTARDYDISFGYGGGLFNTSGTITVRGSTFRDNAAIGGSNATAVYGRGHVGDGSGGGFINLETATISDCSFDHNEAHGGNGNVGGTSLEGGVGAFIVGWGQGGAITNEGWNLGQGTTLTASRLTLTHNEAIGGAGNSGNLLAGAGIGGGINAWWIGSSVTIRDSLFAHNKARGASGANGQGGAMSAVIGAVIQVSGTLIDKNLALGGDNSDGAGGNGFGGGVYVDAASTVGLQTTTVTKNHANAGGGTTSDGVGIGGGVYSLGRFLVDDPASIRHNHASTSNDDIYTQ